MNVDVLITVLSWEDRFFLGLKKNVDVYNPSKVILFKYNNVLTESWKEENFIKTKKFLGDRVIIVEIDCQKPEVNWLTVKDVFAKHTLNLGVLIDITTMTREMIWLSLFNCKKNNCITNYIYYKPQPDGYSSDWVSRDPGKPRLLYKMSGIAKLGAPSLLLVTGGYDIQRLDSLIHNFEPKLTILFFQDGENNRNADNFRVCKELFRAKYNINQLYEYDAYNVESSYKLIIDMLSGSEGDSSESFLDNYNIILNSLGAKTSAITLFKIWLKFPQVALSYIPSNEYNKEYSKGIGEAYQGSMLF